MPNSFHEIAFTDAAKQEQINAGSRRSYERLEAGPARNNALGPNETAFIQARDSFYMASVNENGWPYMQHRGGPAGFVRVFDSSTLGFADYTGNKQYISVGNIASNDRVSLFFMDYANKVRLKMFGRASTLTAKDWAAKLPEQARGDSAVVERGMIIKVEAFEWNCPKHITQRYTLQHIEAVTEVMRNRIAELEAKLAQVDGQ